MPFTAIAFDVKIAVVQVASFGPYSTNVMSPVGAVPPDKVAWSVSTVPIAPPAEATVVITGIVGGGAHASHSAWRSVKKVVTFSPVKKCATVGNVGPPPQIPGVSVRVPVTVPA